MPIDRTWTGGELFRQGLEREASLSRGIQKLDRRGNDPLAAQSVATSLGSVSNFVHTSS